MRKWIVGSVAALGLIVGQAVASEAVSSVAPQFASAGYSSADRAGSGADDQDHAFLGLALIPGLLVGGAIAGLVAGIAVAASQSNASGG